MTSLSQCLPKFIFVDFLTFKSTTDDIFSVMTSASRLTELLLYDTLLNKCVLVKFSQSVLQLLTDSLNRSPRYISSISLALSDNIYFIDSSCFSEIQVSDDVSC